MPKFHSNKKAQRAAMLNSLLQILESDPVINSTCARATVQAKKQGKKDHSSHLCQIKANRYSSISTWARCYATTSGALGSELSSFFIPQTDPRSTMQQREEFVAQDCVCLCQSVWKWTNKPGREKEMLHKIFHKWNLLSRFSFQLAHLFASCIPKSDLIPNLLYEFFENEWDSI